MSKVAVALTNYESAKHLPAAIESVLAQTFKDFTLYCFDNHSPSGEPQQIIQDYASKDERIVAPEIPKGLAGIPLMQLVWRQLNGQSADYSILIGGHDHWHTTEHLEMLVARMQPDVAICYSDTYQINDENQITGAYPVGVQTGMTSRLLLPQALIVTTDAPVLFGLWNEQVRRQVPIRHCCAGWDHLIVTEAALYGRIIWEPRTHLMMRAQGASGANGMESYGRVHLAPEKLKQGAQDFIDQLEWLSHCVDLACKGLPPEAKAANINSLKAAIALNYFVLRGYNLQAVPGAYAQFVQNPLVHELLKGAHHTVRMLDALIRTSTPSHN